MASIRRPERIGEKKHGTIGIWDQIVHTCLDVSGTHHFLTKKLSTPTFRKKELKKDANFSQDHHNS